MKTPRQRSAAQDAAGREAVVLALGEQLSALLSASRALTIETSAEFHPDLPSAAFHIARWLHAFGPAKASRIAEGVAMDRSATSRLISKLVELELAEVKPDPLDGRGVVVSLSRRGKSAISRAVHRKGDALRARIEQWSDADVKQLASLLRRFNGLPEEGGA